MILLNKHISRIFIVFIVFFASTQSFAQQKNKPVVTAEVMKSLTRNGQKIFRYLRSVVILHQGTRMTCDSAYVYQKSNIVEAFNHVVISKDDATLTGDYLYYDGNTSLGRLNGREVRLVQKDTKLTTDLLYFNSKTNSAYFKTGGFLSDKENTLKSQRGYYYSQEKKAYFAGSVELQTKDGKLLTDSLEYGSESELAYFYGPTRIYNKENFVYCEKGWYNRKSEQSSFTQNAYIITKEQKLYGQDIFYDKKKGYANVVGSVALFDSTKNVTIFGGKANYWDSEGEAIVTDDPLLIMADKTDTLFLRSNILSLKTIKDNSLPDSSYKIMRAIGEVKFFKNDVQGLCDSLIYNTKDSTISMINNPVLWNENYQVTANFIKAFLTTGNKIRKMNFETNPMMVSREAATWFNQIKGKNMIARFQNGKLHKLDVIGNGQTVYFLKDNGEIVTVNKVESSDLTVSFSNNTLSRILFKKKPVSTLYPIEKVDLEEVVLKGFKWLENQRPKSKLDIIKKGKKINLMQQEVVPLKKKAIVE